jgi:excisionase family DNA binding protein
MYTTTEAAQLLGVERRTVNQYIRRGQLKADKHGRDLFITQAELERFQRERPRLGWPKGVARKTVKLAS